MPQATWRERFDRPIQKPSIVDVPGRLGVGRGAQRDEQRNEVLDGRVGVGHARSPGCGSPRGRRRHRARALARPRRRSPPTSPGVALPAKFIAGQERQAVGGEAGSDDEHALLAKLTQPAAQASSRACRVPELGHGV